MSINLVTRGVKVDLSNSAGQTGGDASWGSAPTIGILGGGQLARMLCLAGIPMGIKFRILERELDCPAADVCPDVRQGDWNDPDEVAKFGEGCDVVTMESEFVEASALHAASGHGITILPSPQCMAIVQDKFLQKSSLRDGGVAVPRFLDAPDEGAILRAGADLGWPLVLKTRKLGYDGKGNTTVHGADDVRRAWEALGAGRIPLFCEEFVQFSRELAVMITTATSGTSVVYPLVETIQKDHICHEVLCPAKVEDRLSESAVKLARQAVKSVDGIGTFGVEMFETADGQILVNELAPRVHNSGHYTIEACETSQFENHIRAVLGLEPGSARLIDESAVMINILGETDGCGWPAGLSSALKSPVAHMHWYGKSRSRKGRKMGHITATGPDMEDCRSRARRLASLIYRD